jgi:hypothetical protein
LLLLAPILKAVLFEHFSYLVWEYVVVFAIVIVVTMREFGRCNLMRERYEGVGEEAEKRFEEIREEFNGRFDFMKMEYHRGVSEKEESYLEIKIVKEKK